MSAGVLAGEVALVTGGNRGIGFGMARGLAEAGASVCIWSRDADRNAQAVAELKETHADVAAFECDVSDEDQVVDAFARTIERFGKVDACFANAGRGSALVPFTDLTLDQWREVLAVNLDGAMLTLREAARHMVDRGEGGALVGVSSTSAVHGAPNNATYAVGKTAMLALTRSLAVELARHSIRSNAVLPGWTDTEMLEAGKGSDVFVDATVRRTPVRRWADPAEFGAVAVYLARRDLTFHTGDELVVDGGYTRF